jgi:hypothetical protein
VAGVLLIELDESFVLERESIAVVVVVEM